ncbi:MAG: GNAT family N-acetyltransferase [Chloroflexia bacterium]
MVIRAMAAADLPAVVEIWAAQRSQALASGGEPGGLRSLHERRALAEARFRSGFDGNGEKLRALVAERDVKAVAYLIGRDVRLPRGSTYLTYVPEQFLNVGADDWGAATAADSSSLADLYAALASWVVSRGAGTHLVAIEPGADGAELWADLGFARQDSYAYLPLELVRAGAPDPAVRRATVADLDAAAELIIAEARYHHEPPIFAYAPPGLEEAKRRDMAESLEEGDSFVLVAEVNGAVVGAINAYYLADPPFWAATAVPTPCIYIDSAFVRPEARGLGVLRSLVAGLAGAAPAGTAGLFVTYLPANFVAARAWRGLGFRPFALIHQRRLDPRVVRQRRGGARA